MAGKGGARAGEFFKKLAVWLIGLGVLLAMLKIFHDPFGIVNWVLGTCWNIINDIANFFVGNDTFRKTMSKPQG